MDLSALYDFRLVVAHGGFGRASRASGRAKATLSRRVAELEAALGVRLFERGTRTLRLTQEGQNLHARIDGPLGEVLEATDDVTTGGGRVRGRLRVSTPVLFGHVYMGRLASAFARLHPEVGLEVVAGDRHVDLVEEDFDVAIRVNPKPDELLIGRRFMTDRLLAVSTAPLSPEHEGPFGNETVPVAAVVLSRTPEQDRWDLMADGRRRVLAPRPILRLSSVLMVRDAVLADVGAALLPQSLVADDLAAARLVSWGELAGHDIGLWVLHTSRRLVSARVTAFVDFLAASFSDERASPKTR